MGVSAGRGMYGAGAGHGCGARWVRARGAGCGGQKGAGAVCAYEETGCDEAAGVVVCLEFEGAEIAGGAGSEELAAGEAGGPLLECAVKEPVAESRRGAVDGTAMPAVVVSSRVPSAVTVTACTGMSWAKMSARPRCLAAVTAAGPMPPPHALSRERGPVDGRDAQTAPGCGVGGGGGGPGRAGSYNRDVVGLLHLSSLTSGGLDRCRCSSSGARRLDMKATVTTRRHLTCPLERGRERQRHATTPFSVRSRFRPLKLFLRINPTNIATLSNSSVRGPTRSDRVLPAEVAESDVQPVTNYTLVVAFCVRLTHYWG